MTYLKKPYFVTVTTFHMGVLLHFNNTDSLGFAELQISTKLPEKELQKQLQSLIETKLLCTEVQAAVHIHTHTQARTYKHAHTSRCCARRYEHTSTHT